MGGSCPEQRCEWLDTLTSWLARWSHDYRYTEFCGPPEEVAVSPPDVVSRTRILGLESLLGRPVEELEIARGWSGRRVRVGSR